MNYTWNLNRVTGIDDMEGYRMVVNDIGGKSTI